MRLDIVYAETSWLKSLQPCAAHEFVISLALFTDVERHHECWYAEHPQVSVRALGTTVYASPGDHDTETSKVFRQVNIEHVYLIYLRSRNGVAISS